jgi:DNA invertase Pin-like site-specific DNA recombinase
MIAAVYARKSTEQSGIADEQKSVARQIEHARAYAIRKGWTVDDAHVYVDDGISGAEFANRPGFLRLMNALKPRPSFQILVMSEESRLGREAIETAYALKQLVTAGVRVFFYLEDRERTLDSPTDKIMLSLTAFADELEREKARQRTYDAMVRKAKAGHVTGGRLFGYDNRRTEAGHVERIINDGEAAIVRRIFDLSAAGHGHRAIAKLLNAEGAPSPRAPHGHQPSWAPSSVREVLYREVYRGVVTWNRTQKRNRWGQKQQAARPAADWMSMSAPSLRIVSDEQWTAAHARLSAARRIYEHASGQKIGRPALGDPSKYLLTNLVLCGCCGGPMRVRSRSHGNRRKFFYGCSGYHERGRTVCANGADVPMIEADDIVIEALLDEVLDASILRDSVDAAVRLLQGDDDASARRAAVIEAQLAKVEQERARLVDAIAAGGQLDGLLSALQTREAMRTRLEADYQALRTARNVEASEAGRIRGELIELADSWRRVLADDPTHARPIISALLVGRVTITPAAGKRWMLTGAGTLTSLFERTIFPSRWRPQREQGIRIGQRSFLRDR